MVIAIVIVYMIPLSNNEIKRYYLFCSFIEDTEAESIIHVFSNSYCSIERGVNIHRPSAVYNWVFCSGWSPVCTIIDISPNSLFEAFVSVSPKLDKPLVLHGLGVLSYRSTKVSLHRGAEEILLTAVLYSFRYRPSMKKSVLSIKASTLMSSSNP